MPASATTSVSCTTTCSAPVRPKSSVTRPRSFSTGTCWRGGVNWTDANHWQLPARPPLRLTQPFEEGGKSYVGLGRIAQPARGGFEQWLVRQGITVARPADAPSGIVLEEHYVKFMSKAL